MTKALAKIDLRRDLPKVRENWRSLVQHRGKCLYASPCIVGVMVPKEVRPLLDEPMPGKVGSPPASVLIEKGILRVPAKQIDDLIELQEAFDNYELGTIKATLAELETKYRIDAKVSADA